MCRDLFYTHTYSHTDILTYSFMHHNTLTQCTLTYIPVYQTLIYTCTFTHSHTEIHTFIPHTCPLTLAHTPPHTTYAFTQSHAHLCTHSCKRPHTYVHMHAFAHIHTFTHTHTFTYKHTQAHSQTCYLLPAFFALCPVLAAPFSAICGVPSVQGVIWDRGLPVGATGPPGIW